MRDKRQEGFLVAGAEGLDQFDVPDLGASVLEGHARFASQIGIEGMDPDRQ